MMSGERSDLARRQCSVNERACPKERWNMEDTMLEANAHYDIVVSETKRFEINNGITGLEHLTPALAPLPIYACLSAMTCRLPLCSMVPLTKGYGLVSKADKRGATTSECKIGSIEAHGEKLTDVIPILQRWLCFSDGRTIQTV